MTLKVFLFEPQDQDSVKFTVYVCCIYIYMYKHVGLKVQNGTEKTGLELKTEK